MGNKTDRGNIACNVSGQRCHQRPLVAQGNIDQPHLFELLLKQLQ